MIKLLIADDHQMFREGIAALLKEEKDVEVVAQSANGEEVLSMVSKNEIDVILLDIEMPVMDGFDTMRALIKNKSDVKVLALTMHNTAEFAKNIMKTGFHGFLKKDVPKATLLHAIRTVFIEGKYFDEETQQMIMQSLQRGYQSAQLSPREVEIVKCIADGKKTKEIAEMLFISKHTVESHRQNILLKLDLKNAAELVKYAIQRGIL